jgi:dTMP kinase
MTPAPFLSLDGIDGTGKSTQCQMLVEWLNTSSVPAVGCADPGGTPLGDQLRQTLLASRAEISPVAEALLFMASRAELVAKFIRPALASGQVVVSDRFLLANVAYQGHGHGLAPDDLWSVGQFATGGLLPDLTLVLDLPVDQAVLRRGRSADRVEGRGNDYLQRVRDGFRTESARRPVTIQLVDAAADAAAVQRRLREIVRGFLVQRGYSIKDTQ